MISFLLVYIYASIFSLIFFTESGGHQSPHDNNSNHSFNSVNEHKPVLNHSKHESNSNHHHHQNSILDESNTANLSYSPSHIPPSAPPFLQMQQLLQQHIFSPNQLQQLFRNHSFYVQQLQQTNSSSGASSNKSGVGSGGVQHPSQSPNSYCNKNIFDSSSKQTLEQMMSSLQEQLHLNLLQQSNFLNPQKISPPGVGAGKKEIQQSALLQQQHQELLQQMQMVQRQYMMHQGLSMPSMTSQRQGRLKYYNFVLE